MKQEKAFRDSHLNRKMLTHAAFCFWVNSSVAFFFFKVDIYVTRRKTDGIFTNVKLLSYGNLRKYLLHSSLIFLHGGIYSYLGLISKTYIYYCIILISKQEVFKNFYHGKFQAPTKVEKIVVNPQVCITQLQHN